MTFHDQKKEHDEFVNRVCQRFDDLSISHGFTGQEHVKKSSVFQGWPDDLTGNLLRHFPDLGSILKGKAWLLDAKCKNSIGRSAYDAYKKLMDCGFKIGLVVHPPGQTDIAVIRLEDLRLEDLHEVPNVVDQVWERGTDGKLRAYIDYGASKKWMFNDYASGWAGFNV